MVSRPKHILPLIIFSQFACTSLWFAGNAIVDDLAATANLGPQIAAHMLSAVQFGFIVGTLLFAALLIVDRFSPSKVFMVSALLGAACNLPLLLEQVNTPLLLSARFLTGFFLAGIYPVGMKIASDYYEAGLGKALGFLVGALVLGTALPYLLQGSIDSENYKQVIWGTSLLALIGGMTIGFGVPEGPFRKPLTKLKLKEGLTLFKIPAYKKASVGYFGHMWELYAFWGFTPLALGYYNEGALQTSGIAIITFVVIMLGTVSCSVGGYISNRYGSRKVALVSLIASGALCLVSPWLFELPKILFLTAWCIWGMVVIADSPQFSTLVAKSAPEELRGTALTITNCIGFAISILAIQGLSYLDGKIPINWMFFPLALGPVLGILYFRKPLTNSKK